ncbi:MAG: hypothetical protein VKJ64_03360 [Leptolyngbyaceae bacterium]|nr:hypothetical protein [Leptolyngbyaceae bacterium]
MILILILVIGLVSWALHLMQEAMDKSEFSLMLAGLLVSSAAAALVAVYLLMGHYMAYRSDLARYYQYQSSHSTAQLSGQVSYWYEDRTSY